MENIKIRCKCCNKELESISGKTISCGCNNMATICDNKISAVDLKNIVMVSSLKKEENISYLTNEDLAWQEARSNRKVRKLEFEVK